MRSAQHRTGRQCLAFIRVASYLCPVPQTRHALHYGERAMACDIVKGVCHTKHGLSEKSLENKGGMSSTMFI